MSLQARGLGQENLPRRDMRLAAAASGRGQSPKDQGAALMSAGNPVHLAERYMSNPTRMFSMNMPVDVHRALKREAFERETTMGEIVLDALKQWGIAQQTNEEGAGREDDRNRE